MRSCDNPAPKYGGKQCVGKEAEGRSCNTAPCPVDCVWEGWSEWSPCSASCEGGTESRSRGYEQIAEHGGEECQGSSFEQKECNQHKCPGKKSFKLQFLASNALHKYFSFCFRMQMLACLIHAILVWSAPLALRELMCTSAGLVLAECLEME